MNGGERRGCVSESESDKRTLSHVTDSMDLRVAVLF